MPLGVLTATSLIAAVAVLAPQGSSSAAEIPTIRVRGIRTLTHDPGAFCQGLVVHDGMLIEGTGLYEKSRLRKVSLETGRIENEIALNRDVFGEGVTVWKNQILQLTWKNGYLIVYEADTLRQLGVVRYDRIDPALREGWGITHDGKQLIISDGSSQLRFLDPETFRMIRQLTVRNGFRAVDQLNELEFVDGRILANIWHSDRIASIDPESGRVREWLDCSALRPKSLRWNREAVLNGIAWDSVNRRLYVTGKNWPVLFEIAPPETPGAGPK